jgi:hypothetical protein
MKNTVHCLGICDIHSVSKTVSISVLGVMGGDILLGWANQKEIVLITGQ